MNLDPETIVRVAPLLSGQLLDRRRAKRRQLVSATISLMGNPAEFMVKELREAARKYLAMELDEPTVAV